MILEKKQIELIVAQKQRMTGLLALRASGVHCHRHSSAAVHPRLGGSQANNKPSRFVALKLLPGQ
jgi:hypothetical protein